MNSFTSVISPEPAACGQVVRLGPIDQIAPRVYMISMLFYKLSEGADIRQVHSNIRLALYNTLQDIPQLMTVVRPCNNSQREDYELAYVSGRGAILTFKDYASTAQARAQWPHGTFDEIAAQHFPYAVCERRLVLNEPVQYPDGTFPGLTVQTNFIPGGMLLTGQLFHTICDGTGNFLFFQTLARHCKAISSGQKPRMGIPGISFLERPDVVVPDHDVHMGQFPDWKPVKSADDFLDPVHYDPVTSPDVHYGIFFIDEDKLQRLRECVTSKSHRPSSVEALGAFIWQQVLQARRIDASQYPETKLSIAVDTRSRMAMPVVPTNFWGNLSEPNAVARMPTSLLSQSSSAKQVRPQEVLGTETASSGAVRQIQEVASGVDPGWQRTIGEAARRIRKALVAVDTTAVRRLVGLLNQMPKANSLTWNVDRWPGPDMLMVCINYHFYNHLDFGNSMGRAHAGRCMIGDTDKRPDGRVLLLPPRWQPRKGYEVAIQYDLETLERLEASEVFMEFFERWN